MNTTHSKKDQNTNKATTHFTTQSYPHSTATKSLSTHSVQQRIFDSSTDTYTDGPERRDGRLTGIIRLGGKIISGPYESDFIGQYDPSDDTATNGDEHGQTTPAYNRPDLDPFGRVIFTPRSASVIGIYDAINDEFTEGPEHFMGTLAYDGAVSASTLLDPEILPPGWKDLGQGTAMFPLGENEEHSGVAIITDFEGDEWNLMRGYHDGSHGYLHAITTTNEFQSVAEAILRQGPYLVEVGGMSHTPDRVAGCWMEHPQTGGGRLGLMWYHNKSREWETKIVSNDADFAYPCDSSAPKEVKSNGKRDIGVIWGASNQGSKFVWFDHKSDMAIGQPDEDNYGFIRGTVYYEPINLPGRHQVSLDMLGFFSAEQVEERGARVLAVSAGQMDRPVQAGGIHVMTMPSMIKDMGANLNHQRIATAQSGDRYGPMSAVAISDRGLGKIIYYDDYHSEVRHSEVTLFGHGAGTPIVRSAFEVNEPLDWIVIEEVGVANYVGVFVTKSGRLYTYNTTDGGSTWETETLQFDVAMSGENTENYQKADVAFDHDKKTLIVAYTATSGIRILTKDFTPTGERVTTPIGGEDFHEFLEEERAESLFKFDFQQNADKANVKAVLMRLLAGTVILGVLGFGFAMMTRRLDLTLAATAAVGVTGLRMWNIIEPWLFAALILGAALMIVRGFYRGMHT